MLGIYNPTLAAAFSKNKDPSRNLARKLPLVGGLIGASTIIVANYVKGDGLVIAVLSLIAVCK